MGSNVPQMSIGQQWQNARTQRSSAAGSLTRDIGNNVSQGGYTIQFGDTLSEIVASLRSMPGYKGTGDPARDLQLLAQANGISDPNKIQAGQKLDVSVLVGGGNTGQVGGASPLNQAGGFNNNPALLMQQFAQFQAMIAQQQGFGFNNFGFQQPFSPFNFNLGSITAQSNATARRLAGEQFLPNNAETILRNIARRQGLF